jgi:hypothetical protein
LFSLAYNVDWIYLKEIRSRRNHIHHTCSAPSPTIFQLQSWKLIMISLSRLRCTKKINASKKKSDAIERHPTTGRREMQAPQIKEHLESKVNEHKKPWRQDQPIVVYGNFIIANGWDLLFG